jgi:predicted P-loop ATPase
MANTERDFQASSDAVQALTDYPHTAGELLEANTQHLGRLVPFAEHWFCWGTKALNKDKAPKVPIDPKTGKAGSASDPATAGTFEQATAQVVRGYGYGRGGGVGVLMTTAAAGFVGLDFDDVRDPDSGEVSELGAEVIRHFAGAYVEVSPSGKGLRVFCLGSISASKNTIGGGSVEVYPGGALRFLRVTGALVAGCAGSVVECQTGLDWLAGRVAAAKGKAAAGGAVGSVAGGEAANDPALGGGAGVVVAGAVEATSDSIEAKVEAMSVGAVEEALFEAWNPDPEAETKHPAVVVEALRNMAKPGRPLGQRLAKLREGKEDSEDDQFLCCAAVRGGALTVGDAAEVLLTLAGAGGREKVTQRGDYRTRTAKNALRSVLVEVLEHRAGLKKVDGRSFRGWAFLKEGGGGEAPSASAWALPGGLVEALNKSGDVLALGKGGRPLADDGNVVAILRNDPEAARLLAFNELHQKAMRMGSWAVFDRDATTKPGIVEDDDAMRVCMWLSRKHGIRARVVDTMRCIEAASRHQRVNPMAQRLDELAANWDGVERVNEWLTRWAGADDTGCREYISAAGRCFLVSAVARALQPGCKVDTVLTLEGEAGGGKSTLFRVLSDAVLPDMFTDSVGDASAEVSVVRATLGKWIAELPELAAVRKAADVEALKASLSRGADNYKPPYAITARDYERRFVFVATTNKSQYISDTDGALLRRFMPVRTAASETAMLDLEGLKREAGQLWGEAVRMYRAGVKWRIDAADGAAFTQWVAVRSGRKEDGVFHDEVVAWLAGTLKDEPYKRRTMKCIAEAVEHTKAQQGDKLAQAQLADTLRSVGMFKKKIGGLNWWQLSEEGAQRLAFTIGEGQAQQRAEEAQERAANATLNDKWAA